MPTKAQVQYEATLAYSDGSTQVTTDGVTWSASNAHAIISENGMVSTITPGSVQIMASLDNLTGERTLHITSATLAGLTVTPPDASIPKGVGQNYQAQGIYSDGTTLDLTRSVAWSSSDAAIATIDHDGRAFGVGEGSVTLTASLDNQAASASLTVTAAILSELTITPA
ncbi:Ig-like domain-containing protein, partial [Aeromonas enteropelogenes]|uniref:Ig-like domain-containing protein n=1 Tax=Aeromonas enteropelogenes TaxID=29489 RepID=UPI003BA1B405